MLLLHGYGASLESWKDITPLLSYRFSLYLIDLKGFGLSSKPTDDKYSPEDQAEIITRFIEDKRLSNVILVGHSYGGAVALLTYFKLKRRNHRNYLQSLILIDTAAYPQKLPIFVLIPRTPIINTFVLNLVPSSWKAKFTLSYLFHDQSKLNDERIERYARFYDMPGSHYAFIKAAQQIFPDEIDHIIEAITQIDIPTLIVWGKEDPVISVESAYKLNESIKNSRLEIIPHCGHIPHEENPLETASVIDDFLK